jgi:mRNA interferase YafQ
VNIEPTSQFRRDFAKRIKGTPLETEFATLLDLLVAGGQLPSKYGAHPLKNNRDGYWDCHLRSDMVLLYRRTPTVLRLFRIGTHSDLFG